MTLLTLEDARQYLRVDSHDEDTLITTLLSTSASLCIDVARFSKEQWADLDSDKTFSANFSRIEITRARELMKTAILYGVGYLYEHREEADHHDLVMTLRNLLFSVREGVF